MNQAQDQPVHTGCPELMGDVSKEKVTEQRLWPASDSLWFTAKWARQDSNLRPTGYEPAALPLSYKPILFAMKGFIFMATKFAWSGRRDSNPRHPAWRAGTLPLSYSRQTEPILPQILQLVNKKRLLCSQCKVGIIQQGYPGSWWLGKS
jgi:hypothetical protein